MPKIETMGAQETMAEMKVMTMPEVTAMTEAVAEEGSMGKEPVPVHVVVEMAKRVTEDDRWPVVMMGSRESSPCGCRTGPGEHTESDQKSSDGYHRPQTVASHLFFSSHPYNITAEHPGGFQDHPRDHGYPITYMYTYRRLVQAEYSRG